MAVPSPPVVAVVPVLAGPEQVAANRRRALVLALAVLAAPVVLGALVGLAVRAVAVGVVLGVLIGLAVLVLAWTRGDALLLARCRARPADPAAYARLHNLVEGLCVAGGLPKPRLYVVDDPARNACSTGRAPRSAAVVVTTGLLEGLDRVELEAVLAHELSHVKAQDTLPATLASGLSVVPVLGDRVLAWTLGPRREAVADLGATSLTRYPPALVSALEKVADGGSALRAGSPPALWLASPGPGAEGDGAPLEERTAALREL